jgi:hypothetical protein
LVIRRWLRSGIASDGVVRREDVEPRMEDGENEMVESKTSNRGWKMGRMRWWNRRGINRR